MSFKAVVWALDQDLPSPAAKLVLVVLAHHAGFQNECWPSYDILSRETQVSKRTLARIILSLLNDGHLSRTRTKRADGQYGGFRYVLNLPEPPAILAGGPVAKIAVPVATVGKTIRTDNRTDKVSKYPTDLETRLEAKDWFPVAKSLGQPSPRILAYDTFKAAPPGALTVDAQVEKFMAFNSGKQLTAAEWLRLWERWCEQATQFSRKLA